MSKKYKTNTEGYCPFCGECGLEVDYEEIYGNGDIFQEWTCLHCRRRGATRRGSYFLTHYDYNDNGDPVPVGEEKPEIYLLTKTELKDLIRNQAIMHCLDSYLEDKEKKDNIIQECVEDFGCRTLDEAIDIIFDEVDYKRM